MDQKAVLDAVVEFREALRTQGINPSRMILFGSHASGQAHEDSDVDLVVISQDFAKLGYWERIDKLAAAIYEVAAPIEAVGMTQEEWDRGDEMIVDFARQGQTVFAEGS